MYLYFFIIITIIIIIKVSWNSVSGHEGLLLENSICFHIAM